MREIEGVVEFTIREQTGVTGDVGAEESEAETAVELELERLGLAVTHEESVISAGIDQKTLEFQGFGAILMPKDVASSGKSGFGFEISDLKSQIKI